VWRGGACRFLRTVGRRRVDERSWGDGWLYVPVIGPWGDLVNREGCAAAGGSCDSEALYRLLIITAGVTQLAGARFDHRVVCRPGILAGEVGRASRRSPE